MWTLGEQDTDPYSPCYKPGATFPSIEDNKMTNLKVGIVVTHQSNENIWHFSWFSLKEQVHEFPFIIYLCLTFN